MPFYSGYATNDRMSVFKKEIVTKRFCKKRLHFPAFIGKFPLPVVETIVHLNPPAGGKSLQRFLNGHFVVFFSVHWSHGRFSDDIIGLRLPGCLTAGAE